MFHSAFYDILGNEIFDKYNDFESENRETIGNLYLKELSKNIESKNKQIKELLKENEKLRIYIIDILNKDKEW